MLSLCRRFVFKEFNNVPQLAVSNRHSSLNASISATTLLNDETRDRVINCMKKAPPVGVHLIDSDKEKKHAAVLILLCTEKNTENVSILYTRRSVHLSRHVRQVSFPGGLQDHTDADAIDCALRETEEEIGLPRNRVELWGTGVLMRPPSTAAIMPVIGVVRNLDLNQLTLNPLEVEDAFTVPISDFIAPGTLRHTQFKGGFSSPLFVVKPYRIWGVTGFLTNNFLHCLLPKEIYKQRVKYLLPYKTKKNM